MLELRLAAGLDATILDAAGRAAAQQAVADGLVDPHALVSDRRVRLTLRGRLLADAVVRALVD